MISLRIIIISIYLFTALDSQGQTYSANWASLDKRPIPDWFTYAKFGIFIHWGVYAVTAWAPSNEDIGVYTKYAEWYWQRINGGKDPDEQKVDVNKMFVDHHNKVYGPNFKYQDFAPMFKAENFNSTKWANIFKDAGAKYVVLTSKHHEGFTLWPSQQSWNWNSVDIGPHKDLCGELANAVKAAGLHMGMYYSLYEWFHPIYKTNPEKYVAEHMIPQLKDLVTNYKPELIYTDGEWDYNSDMWQSEKFLACLYNESAVKNTVVVNDRRGKETRSAHGGFYTSEYGNVNGADTKTSELAAHPWEEIRGIGTSFGYNRVENLSNYLSSRDLIHMLLNIVANGGNLCLNIGPKPDGTIPVIMQQRLHDIGSWLKINGEAIYGTATWKSKPKATTDQTVFYTTKGKDLYVLCNKWEEKSIIVPGVLKAARVTMLGSSAVVKTSFKNGVLTILPPVVSPLNNPSNDAWVYKVEGVL
ncbi:MAG: alpha-L-fucosidase [Ferruginibacter sp.]|nr:alpha-L-fucosidase [Ferruginibacter sp.]